MAVLRQLDPTEGTEAHAMPRGGAGRRGVARPLPRIDAHGGEGLAKGLGWFSVGLGIAQLAMPKRLARMIGVDDDGEATAVMRLLGAREVMTGVGILASSDPTPFVWARVAGDVMDVALVGKEMTDDGADTARLGATLAALGAVGLLDVVAATALSEGAPGKGGTVHVTKAVTIRRPAEELYAYWRDFTNLPTFMTHLERVDVDADGQRSHWVAKAPVGTVSWDAELVEDRPGEGIAWRSLPGARVENAGRVRFVRAPGDQGTEVHVELQANVPGGPAGALVAKVMGEDPSIQVGDDLRRFKQVMETGEVVRSEGTPEGVKARRHIAQRAAQPLPA